MQQLFHNSVSVAAKLTVQQLWKAGVSSHAIRSRYREHVKRDLEDAVTVYSLRTVALYCEVEAAQNEWRRRLQAGHGGNDQRADRAQVGTARVLLYDFVGLGLDNQIWLH